MTGIDASGEAAEVYAYDTATNGIGRLASVMIGSDKTSYSYTAEGQVNRVHRCPMIWNTIWSDATNSHGWRKK